MGLLFYTVLCFLIGLFMGSYIANIKKHPGWTMADQINYLFGLFKK